MLKSIHLENFKVHKDTNIELGSLTILCGPNSSGKSSIIQSILLMAQNGGFMQSFSQAPFNLNGLLCNLGNAKDVLSSAAKVDEITFEFHAISHQYSCNRRIQLAASDLTKDYLRHTNVEQPKFTDNLWQDGEPNKEKLYSLE